MAHGNPNQKKVVEELRNLGYKVSVKRNQIHIEGVRECPFSGYCVPEGETVGHTVSMASEVLKRAKLARNTDLVFQPNDSEVWPKDYKNPSRTYLKMEHGFRNGKFNVTDKMKLSALIFDGYRLTRNEFSTAVAQGLILRNDTDKDYEEYMGRWWESKTQFGVGSTAKARGN